MTTFDLPDAAPPDERRSALLLVADDTPPTPQLDIVVPVFNEEADLARCVSRLVDHLATLPFTSRITIADNASTDRTLEVAVGLAHSLEAVRVAHLDEKGRGRALNAVWMYSDADVVAYMDVDLSTDLKALMPLVAPLVSGHSDIAIGSRLAYSSRVIRGAKREFISRSYNLILRAAMGTHFSDAQCGFKAMRADVARAVLPLVRDHGWFFDTELLVIAERAHLRIAEVPVDWVDDPNSKVDIVKTATEDLRGCWRVGRALTTGELSVAQVSRTYGRESLTPKETGPELSGVPTGMIGQLIRFAIIGVISTVAFAVLYLLLHPMMGAQAANFVALLVTAVLNTAANRAFTFGVRGRSGAASHHLQGLLVFLFGWCLTAGSLYALHHWAPGVDKLVELTVLIVANLVATLTRFVALRWVFRHHSAPIASVDAATATAKGYQK